jgi:hypothetical protein
MVSSNLVFPDNNSLIFDLSIKGSTPFTEEVTFNKVLEFDNVSFIKSSYSNLYCIFGAASKSESPYINFFPTLVNKLLILLT